MPKKLRNLVIDRVDLVDKGANPEAHVVLFKRDATQKEVEMPKKKTEKSLDLESIEGLTEDQKEQIQALQTKVTDSESTVSELTEKVEELKSTNDELAKQVEELSKSDSDEKPLPKMSKAAETLLKKAQAEAEEAKGLAKKNEERLNTEIEKRELMKAEKRAEDLYPNLPGKPEEKGAVLRWVDKNLPEESAVRTSLEKMLSSGEAFAKKFTKASGVDGGSDNTNSAWDRIQVKADEMVEKSDGKITKAQAIDKVMEKDPKLYREYREERGQTS